MRKGSNVKKTSPLVSVCILTWNRKKDLLQSIAYIKKSTYKNIEIIVVDNVSSDGTSKTISRYQKDIVLITRQVNNGIAGWNDAFKTAKGEYLLVLDDDAHPSSDAISMIVDAFENNKKVDILSCNIMNFQTKKSAFNYLREDQKDPLEDYDFIGCGFAMRKRVLKKIGYFSKKLFMYAHETDYSVRALAAGLHIVLYPTIVVWHRVSPVSRTSGRSLYYCTRNFFLISWIYFPTWFALDVTFSIFSECAILAVKNKTVLIYIKALLNCFLNIPWILQQRKPVSYDVVKKVNYHFPFSLKGIMRRSLTMVKINVLQSI